MKRIILIAVLAGLIPSSAAAERSRPRAGAAQEPPSGITQISLAGLLDVIVRKEPSLVRATIDIRIADAAVLAAAGADDWVAAVSGQWLSELVRNAGRKQDAVTLGATLSRSLHTGGTISLHVQSGYTAGYARGGASGPDSLYHQAITATLVQPLWRGRGAEIARSEVVRTRIERDAALLERQSAATDAVLRLITAYWELVLSWRNLAIRQGSLALAKEQLQNTQGLIESGRMSTTEVLAAEQIIANREQDIMNAELAITERSLDVRRLAGLDVGLADLDLWASAPLTVPSRDMDMDIDALLARALARNPRLSALQARHRTHELARDVTRDALDPELDMELSFGPLGVAPDARESVSRMATFDDMSVRVGLTYRRDLGGRTARGRHHIAQRQLDRHRVDLAEARIEVTRELVQAQRRAGAAQRRAVVGQRVIELAARNVQIDKERFRFGRSTSFDVLQRQNDLEQAQLRLARDIVDYLQALAAIDALTGTLLERYGIVLDPAAGS